MVEIKFSHDALSDLKGIKAYIANELLNERAALNTVSDIMKHSRQLVEFPESGAPLSSIVQLDTNYRYLVCGSYTVFYRSEKTQFISTELSIQDAILCEYCLIANEEAVVRF